MPGESQRPPEDKPDPSVYTMEAIERAAQSERDYTDGRIAYVLESIQGLNRALVDERRFMNEVIQRIDDRHRQFDEQAQRLQVASNEWRGALQDRERATVSRVEFDTRIDALEKKEDAANATNAALIAAMAEEMRRQFRSAETKTAEQFEQLRLRNAEAAGGKKSLNDARVWILGVVTAVASVIAIVSAIYAATH